MNDHAKLDLLLNAAAREDEPDEGGFAATLMAGVALKRRQRKIALGAFGGLATVLACAAWWFLPLPAHAAQPERLGNVVASLLLATLCGWIWIESGSIARR